MKRLFLFFALLSSMTIQADHDIASDRFQPIDSLQLVELQDVQVKSTRATQRTPMAFTNLERNDIKRVNHGQDIPYLLSLTPSVVTTSDAGNGIGYTSLRVRGTAPERINITANGIPINDAESNQVFWVNMGDFASSLQSMQIQRGVGTSSNGAGAFGASLNMQTENIGMKPFLGVDISSGSYSSKKQTVRFSTGLPDGGHWGLQGRLSHIGSEGYIDRAETKLYSYFLQYGYFSDDRVVKVITWNGEEETYHAWDFASHYAQDKYGRTYNPCGYMTVDSNGNPVYYKNQTDNYHQQNYQLVWNERFSNVLSLNAGLHYTLGDGYYEQFKGNKKLSEYMSLTSAEAGMRSDLVRQKKMENDFYGVIASLIYNNRNGLDMTMGGGWNKYDGDHFGRVTWLSDKPASYYDGIEYYRNNTQKTDVNFYGKVNYEFLRGLSAYVDLQYRHVGLKMQEPGDWYGQNLDGKYVIDEKYDFLNPKFGLNYQFSPAHRLYASYAIAHKEPVRNNFENNYNAGLENPCAERLNDLEVGYQFTLPRFTAGVNFYWMDYKDQFVLTGEIDPIGEVITRNMPKSYRMGAELEMAWQPVDWFRWNANATFSKNRVKDIAVLLDDYTTTVTLDGEKPLAFSPDLIANNIFTFSYRGLQAAVQSQYVGDQYLTNTGFKEMLCQDANGNDCYETLLLKKHFTTNIDLSYTFGLEVLGLKAKEATLGITLYNVTSEKFDNNGWAAPQYQQNADGSVKAVNTWGVRDDEAAGFAPSAPFNFLLHLSLNF